jgi:hypothetical protein
MDHQPLRHDRSALELVEVGPERVADEPPVLHRLQSQIHSPLAEPRLVEPIRREPSPEALTLPLPSARTVVRSAAWAGLVATPLLLLLGWQVALVLGGLAAATRELDGRLRRANISFADGFLPFHDRSGWPRGVQEEDGVHWNWSPRARNGQPSRP